MYLKELPRGNTVGGHEGGEGLSQQLTQPHGLSQLYTMMQDSLDPEEEWNKGVLSHLGCSPLSVLFAISAGQLTQQLAQVGECRWEREVEAHSPHVEINCGELVAPARLQDCNLVVGLTAGWCHADGMPVEGLSLLQVVAISKHYQGLLLKRERSKYR